MLSAHDLPRGGPFRRPHPLQWRPQRRDRELLGPIGRQRCIRHFIAMSCDRFKAIRRQRGQCGLSPSNGRHVLIAQERRRSWPEPFCASPASRYRAPNSPNEPTIHGPLRARWPSRTLSIGSSVFCRQKALGPQDRRGNSGQVRDQGPSRIERDASLHTRKSQPMSRPSGLNSASRPRFS